MLRNTVLQVIGQDRNLLYPEPPHLLHPCGRLLQFKGLLFPSVPAKLLLNQSGIMTQSS